MTSQPSFWSVIVELAVIK